MPDDFETPGVPSADEIRTQLVNTGSLTFWRPNGAQDGTPTDLRSLPPEQAAKVVEARTLTGPGPSGNHWQHALWQHHDRIVKLEQEQKRLMDTAAEVRGFDPITGEGISMVSPPRQKGIMDRLSQINDELGRLHGEPGRIKLRKELDKAVALEQARYRREYINQEAKRRAAADALEADIERLAAGYRKVQPRDN